MNLLGRTRGLAVFLFALFLLAAAVLTGLTQVKAVSGDVTVSAVVAGPPPVAAPTISQPTASQTFSQKNITVGGTCVADLVVKVFSNDIFVGSTLCQNDNTYTLKVDLFVDSNSLVARQYDLINQPSPDSAAIAVFYLPSVDQPNLPGEQPTAPSEQPSPIDEQPNQSPQPTESVADFQLTIDYDFTSQGAYANQPFRLPVHFLGGKGPFTVLIDWGDGSVNNFVRQDNSEFTAEYHYARPGLYTTTITIRDGAGQEAYLQFVVLVHGDGDPLNTKTTLTTFFTQLATLDLSNPVVAGFTLGVFGGGFGLGVFGPILVRGIFSILRVWGILKT